MKISTRVKVKTNDKLWQKIYRNLNRSKGDVVNVGWWASRHPTGVPVAQVAQWNEEGHITGRGAYSPPRPFLRVDWMNKIKKTKLQKYVNMVNSVAMGKLTWRKLNTILANDLRESLKLEILEWNRIPNSAYTVSLKGFNDPLIDTGTMYDTIKIKIVKRNRGV